MNGEYGTLTVVGTPIGNLGDLSPRAARTFEECDFIAAEDTRVTLKLLNHLNIKKPMVSYYEHNRRASGGHIVERIKSGENCVLVSDAGMPAISDPGEDLVALCHQNGITVTAVPGPTAMATALALSGLGTGRFTFEGFLSVNRQSRREHLQSLVGENRTMVFYEAPHKLYATLRDMLDAFGDRRIVLARELTKLHEEIRPTTLSEAEAYYRETPPKGEFVLVIEGAPVKDEQPTIDEAVSMARELLDKGESVSRAAKEISALTGIRKSDIYSRLIKTGDSET